MKATKKMRYDYNQKKSHGTQPLSPTWWLTAWGFCFRQKSDCVVIEVTDPFYESTRWRKLRKKILQRDKYMCQISKRYGKRVDAVTVHHIYPRSHYPQWQWCSWNLISVSKEAHNRLHDRLTDELTAEGEALKKRTPPPFKNTK